eukprot:TRINITY_DN18745_c0_g1::TRINITY_DN18745_c0_g1_i1::g.15248::m.15248 TRINITY_DN18745_c0_g1::TRINITY_DN18745_c0_g1_i1::g.15248  ORF type:complete len:536 (-),score=69.23,sp/Q9BVK2/ALG8_HUMAN/45.65/7e-137,Alg6_Alg8/PF03155.10/9.2e-127 TRINITY_DN18745_c0_g1_i1:163-1737(-)
MDVPHSPSAFAAAIVFFIATSLKLVLIPAYRSTDFEVHRNWLAITHSLPADQWYTDETSIWTLDYPPFFALFEHLLSQIAVYFDPAMLEVSNLEYASTATILFQRLSVIVLDVLLLFAIRRLANNVSTYLWPESSVTVMTTLAFLNPALLLVDHVHFQYNGFLFAWFLLSLAFIIEGRFISGAVTFAVLLNLKHIFLYCAPAYFFYIFPAYCWNNGLAGFSRLFRCAYRFLLMGVIVIGVTLVAFAPWIDYKQVLKVLSRLFPFKRGLSHAYWAPNLWALYNAADLVLIRVSPKLGWVLPPGADSGSLTRGLVGDATHVILPSISPPMTFLCTILAMLPALVVLFRSPNPKRFLFVMVHVALSSFLTGWHVHEKAILLPLLPLTFLWVSSNVASRAFLILYIVGGYSILPLLFRPQEYLLKISLWAAASLLTLAVVFAFSTHSSKRVLYWFESLYLAGFIPLEILTSFFIPLSPLGQSMPFLPLLLVSVYFAIGVLYVLSLTLYMSFHSNCGADSADILHKKQQ